MAHGILRLIPAVIVFGLLTACGPSGVTAAPTDTRIPPAPAPASTPVPVKEPEPTLATGWKRVQGNGVSLSVPDTYTDFIKVLKDRGGTSASLARAAQGNPEMYRLWLADSTTLDSEHPVHVLINGLTGSDSQVDLKTLLASQAPASSKQTKLKSAENFAIGSRSGARAIIEMLASGETQVTYAVQVDNRIYLVIYSTAADQLEKRLPVFEQSIQTFTVEPRY